MDTNKQMICATPEGLKIAEEALKKLCYGEELNLSKKLTGCVGRSTIQKFFKGEKIRIVKFQDICKELKLDWEEIAGLKVSPVSDKSQEKNNEISKPEIDIDTLVEQMRQKFSADIRKNCGTMKVLDMTQSIGLDDIYTDVNILEKITSTRPLDIEKILEECNIGDFERFSLNPVREERVAGLEAVERYSKLMIFGKPGAGKTTFLKRIAIQCDSGKFLANRLPIFITLKAFAEAENQPNLLQYIYNEFTVNDISAQEAIKILLRKGRTIILLDGLDEVRQIDDERVLRNIRRLANQYNANIFIVTCRIAAKEYIFENFIDVEIADFDDEQIREFITKWFQSKSAVKIEQFIKKMGQKNRIRELANNPLLLTFLCWLFSESMDFPDNRSELYEQGLEILLRKWDGTRNIEREKVYKKLPSRRKEDLLSEIAFRTFQEGNYFFKQRQIEEYISSYIQNLPDAQSDPEALLVDSGAVLKSIESQHGLLVERARRIYSFSHLTFHEYFTARNIYISNNRQEDLKDLVKHITESRWREVFLLIGGMLKNADELVCLMKQTIDQIIVPEQKLQDFLMWVNQKSDSVEISYKPSAVRAFYISLEHSFNFNCPLTINLDHSLDLNSSLTFDLDLDRYLCFTLFNLSSYPFDYSFVVNLNYFVESCCYFARKFNSRLRKNLQEIKEQLPQVSDHKNLTFFLQWWKTNGQAWTEQLRAVMIEYRNIGHDWQFTENQKKLLNHYYNANCLLVECLKECHLTRAVREEIENTLLLPVQRN